MPDYGALETDALIAKMEKRMNTAYRTANTEMNRKLRGFMKDYNEDNKAKKAALKAGKITKEDYEKWKLSKAGQKRWLDEMVNTLSEDAILTNAKAMSIVRGFMPEAYAINRNYGAFQVEKGALIDTSFTLYDAHTVERIVKERPDLLPQPKPDIPKEMRWHKQKINNAITQGILQGESIPDIAARLEAVTGMDNRAAIRNARTATTAAQNAGRVDSYKDAKKMGIDVKQQWIATLDGRTRDSHRMLDGEIQEVGKKFSNGCEYPGDPKAHPAEIYNCRCTLIAVIDGKSAAETEGLFKYEVDGMSYDEWKKGKRQGKATAKRESKQGAKTTDRRIFEKKKEEEKVAVVKETKQVDAAKTKQEKTTMRQKPVSEMTREQLVAEAKKIYIKENSSLGEAEALRRFNLLVGGNSTSQLRNYVRKRRRK